MHTHWFHIRNVRKMQSWTGRKDILIILGPRFLQKKNWISMICRTAILYTYNSKVCHACSNNWNKLFTHTCSSDSWHLTCWPFLLSMTTGLLLHDKAFSGSGYWVTNPWGALALPWQISTMTFDCWCDSSSVMFSVNINRLVSVEVLRPLDVHTLLNFNKE